MKINNKTGQSSETKSINGGVSGDMVDQSQKTLYKIGGVIAFILAAITLTQFVAFMVAPPPLNGTALDWFNFFAENWLFGLLGFEILMVVYVLLSSLLALSLFFALRKVNQSFMAIFLGLSFIGAVSFIAARPVFEMLSLSNQYTAATSDAQRTVLLAAGEGMIAAFQGTSFHISYILGSVSGLLVAFVMLKSTIFSKKTAYLRISSSIFDFGLYVPTIGIFISIFSVFFLFAFNILVGRRLLQLSAK